MKELPLNAMLNRDEAKLIGVRTQCTENEWNMVAVIQCYDGNAYSVTKNHGELEPETEDLHKYLDYVRQTRLFEGDD